MEKKNILKGKENMKITRKIIFFFYIMHHSYYYIIYNWQINWHFKLFEIGPRILLFIPHNHIIIICLFFENMNIDRLYSLISRIIISFHSTNVGDDLSEDPRKYADYQ